MMSATTGTMRTTARIVIGAAVVAAALSSAALAIGETITAGDTTGALGKGAVSGLPVPRYVSLKPDRVNVRVGPDQGYGVDWVYTRSGLPVEVTAESGNWRRVRDWEGAEGWVYHSLLSGRRTAIVQPASRGELVPLYADPSADVRVIARLQPGVVAAVSRCDGKWCEISGDGFAGWMVQDRLWGVYPSEQVD
jgi:SH3-like domain-containing protein